MALAGGSTPKALYHLLTQRSDIAWDKIQFFWGDERHVPPDHADSNFRMAKETMLDHVSVPAANIHRIKSENPDAAAAAAEYAAEMQSVFHTAPAFPRVGPTPSGKENVLDPVSSPQSWYAQWAARALHVTGGEGGVLARLLLKRLAAADEDSSALLMGHQPYRGDHRRSRGSRSCCWLLPVRWSCGSPGTSL